MLHEFIVWSSVISTLFLLSTLLVGMRLYHRHTRHKLKASDYTSFASWLLILAFTGLGIHLGKLTLVAGDGITVLQIIIASYLENLVLRASVPLIKISIVLLYLEIAQSKWHKIALRVLLGILIAAMTVFLTTTLFGCSLLTPDGPFWSILDSHAFDRAASNAPPKCLPIGNTVLAYAYVNVICEALIVVLSIPFVWRVKVSTQQRAGLAFAFALGFFTIAASVIAARLFILAYDSLINRNFKIEYLYTGGLWGATEVNAAFIFANLLPVRAVLMSSCARMIRGGCLQREAPGRKSSQATTSHDSEVTADSLEKGVRTRIDRGQDLLYVTPKIGYTGSVAGEWQ